LRAARAKKNGRDQSGRFFYKSEAKPMTYYLLSRLYLTSLKKKKKEEVKGAYLKVRR
jgi:hypothetical protein